MFAIKLIKNQHDLFKVDEYVDLNTNRSSISIYDILLDETQIYYSQLDTNGATAGRKFIEFDLSRNLCRSKRIDFWPLAMLKRVAISMYPDDGLDRRLDVAIGPSVILYAIENSLNYFNYTKTIYSTSLLTNVDIYERKIDFETIEDYDRLNIRVSIFSLGRRQPEFDETLAQSISFHNHLDFASVVACKVSNNDNVDSMPNINNDQLFQDIGCDSDEILFSIDYNLIDEFSIGSLIGRRIDEQAYYEFQREPFVQPVGMGCWETDQTLRWQKIFNAPSMQFSAEYTSSNGSRGVSYVAFDGYSSVLRLDRDGRKSVYDLAQRKSYHIGEFSLAHEVDSSSHDNYVTIEKCVVLKIDETDFYGKQAIARLLGLGNGQQTHHMGSKMVDHISYEVFETEITYGQYQSYYLPILLETIRFTLEKSSSSSKRHFITFYVHEYPSIKLDSREQNGYSEESATVMLPKFIELWEWNTETKSQKLINRLTFTEFSWSLDVQPSNDPDTQSDLGNLFDIEQCHRARATQAELTFKINQFVNHQLRNESMINGLRSNEQLIKEILQEKLPTTLGISRLNLAHTDVKILNSGDIIVKSRIVDLRFGLNYQKRLGLVYFHDDILEDYIVKVFFNRHSLNACKLDSLSWPKSSLFAYCPKLTICVILEQNNELIEKIDLNNSTKTTNETTSSSDNEYLKCEAYNFKWAQGDDLDRDAAIKLVNENKYKIGGLAFDFKFRYQDEVTGQIQTAKYFGFCVNSQFKPLDSIGSKLALSGSSSSSLAGLSYSTKQEEPLAYNMNRRLKLSEQLDAFKHCNLACQMDDFCGSFSVCLRKNKKNDCILSTLRLSGELIAKISSNSAKNRKEDKFELKVTSSIHSQVFIMYHDSECSLHPKDFLSEFTIKESIELTGPSSGNQILQNNQTNHHTNHRHLTLEDCAGLSFETNLFTDPINSNFTYCPLDMYCIINGNIPIAEQSGSSHCFFYAKRFTRFYEQTPMNHMVINLANDTSEQSISDNKKNNEIRSEQPKLVRPVFNLTQEGCARECNLHQSKCLAFDICHQSGHSVCFLFSIRSPHRYYGLKLPLLPHEQQLTYSDESNKKSGGVMLTSNVYCDHYWLKLSYFQVRLRQMHVELNERDEVIPKELKDRLDSVENSILDADRKQSDLDIKSNSANATETELQFQDSKHQDKNSSGGIQLLMLTIGMLLGSFIGLYGRQMTNAAVNVYQSYKLRRGHANEGLSQLVLNDEL